MSNINKIIDKRRTEDTIKFSTNLAEKYSTTDIVMIDANDIKLFQDKAKESIFVPIFPEGIIVIRTKKEVCSYTFMEYSVKRLNEETYEYKFDVILATGNNKVSDEQYIREIPRKLSEAKCYPRGICCYTNEDVQENYQYVISVTFSAPSYTLCKNINNIKIEYTTSALNEFSDMGCDLSYIKEYLEKEADKNRCRAEMYTLELVTLMGAVNYLLAHPEQEVKPKKENTKPEKDVTSSGKDKYRILTGSERKTFLLGSIQLTTDKSKARQILGPKDACARNIIYKQDMWDVRGHYRHLKSGKIVYVKPFVKGRKK